MISYPDLRLPPFSDEDVFIQPGADQGNTMIFRWGVTDLISESVDHRYAGELSKLNDPREVSSHVSSRLYAEEDKSVAPKGTLMIDNAADEAPSVARIKCEITWAV